MSGTRACSLADLEVDRPFATKVDDTYVAIVRTPDEVFAIHDECSHQSIALSEGEVDGCTLECFAHGSRFDLRTGRPLDPPAVAPVPVYPVTVIGDDVFVDVANPISQES